MGLCFRKCKDPKRTWFSYSCVRCSTKCASEIVRKICDYLWTCSCCCCCYLTLPIGFCLVILGFFIGYNSWPVAGFNCFGYCCQNETFLEWILGGEHCLIGKKCFNRLRNCDWCYCILNLNHIRRFISLDLLYIPFIV